MSTDVDAIVRSLAAWRSRHLRRAWRPVIASPAFRWQTVNSQFGGVPLVAAGEDWPHCPGCRKPMELMVQFDLAHLPAGLYPRSAGLLQYFQCPNGLTCYDAAESFVPFNPSQLVRVVPADGLHPAAVPTGFAPHPVRPVARWVPFWDLPSGEEHERLGLVYDYDFAPEITRVTVAWPEGGVPPSAPVETPNDGTDGLEAAVAFAAGGDKLGGWPVWVQRVDYPSCPDCGAEMAYLLQLDWHDNLPETFGDLGTAQVFFCPTHPEVLTAAWQCG